MNHNTFHPFRFALSLLCATALLAACGGSGGSPEEAAGGDNPPASSATPAYTSISGVVAYGSGSAGAEVDLYDLDGKVTSTITDAMGGFMIPLSTLTRALKPPFAIQAKFRVAERTFNLLSISQGVQGGDVRMNVTPITDLIARTHLAADGEDPMAVDLDTPIPNNPSRLRRIIDNAKEMFGSKLPSDVRDFTSEYFKTSPTQFEMDALLERVKVEIDSTGVTLKTALGKVLAKRSLAQMRSDQSRTDDDSTITDQEAKSADEDRGELPLGEQVAVNLLPVAYSNELIVDVNGSFNVELQGINAERFAITKQPLNGTLELVNASQGLYIYVPKPGWTGTDEFLFTAINQYGVSSPVKVTLVVSDGCDSDVSGPVGSITYSRRCAVPWLGTPVVIAPAAGYPFRSPEPLTVSGGYLTTHYERGAESTNLAGVPGIDLSRSTVTYDKTTDRFVVTTSAGFYNRTTGARIPDYGYQDFTRSRAIYARHPSGAGYVLTGYAEAKMAFDTPMGFDAPYEFGYLTRYALQSYDVNGRPLYTGAETLCLLEPVSIPFSLFLETVKTVSNTGAMQTSATRTNKCSISMDQLASIAYETRPADLRHTGF